MHKDAVEHIVFNFFNNALYKISVTYERKATEGLTANDMIESLSRSTARPPMSLHKPLKIRMTDMPHGANPSHLGKREYAFSLVRSTFSDDFELVVISKRLNAEAETAVAEASKLDEQERPQKDAERQKKETADLELARQKNQKSFRP